MIDIHKLAKDLEFFETPVWAAKAILKKEIMTRVVYDPCAGRGVLSKAAKEAGYDVVSADIHDWGYPLWAVQDFLGSTWPLCDPFSVIVNPPFSKARKFLEHALALGARKVLVFQRASWLESDDRRTFWDTNPPNRIYICSDRATCWRGDLVPDKRGFRYDPVTGKRLSDSTTTHAWFVWEPSQPGRMQTGFIRKKDAL